MCLNPFPLHWKKKCRHIVLCVPIFTNELTNISSALEREMKDIVLCVSISTNELATISSALEWRNETHCSMCVDFYE